MKKSFLGPVWPDCNHHVKVELTPLGSKIRYRIFGKVFCERQQQEMPNSRTYSKDDMVWQYIFGTRVEIEKFLKRNKTITRVVTINKLGYDQCDWVK